MKANKVVKNMSWIVGCKIAQSFITLIVGSLTARFLGPANYGLLNYANSIVSFFVPLMQLGLDAVLVHFLVSDSENEGTILGSAIGMSTISGVISVAAIILFTITVNKGEQSSLVVCMIYSVSLVFRSVELFKYWFQAKLLSKYNSLATLFAYILVSAYKLYLLITQKNVYWFAFAVVVDHFLISLLLVISYHKLSSNKLSFSWKMAGRLLSKSKYYIISAMVIVVFQQTDKLMLKVMLDETATGIYSAAITCAGIAGFVYSAIIDSARPIILNSRIISEHEFHRNISFLYSIIFYLSLLQSVVVFLFAELMVLILYGPLYSATVPVLRIGVWYVTYSYFGTVRNIWLQAENKHRYLWIIDVTGAIVNVGLNYLLIPVCGAKGAAIATLITQIFTNVIIGFILPAVRENNRLMLKGINLRFFVVEAWRILENR